jgi:hypothetical protein
MGRTLQASKEGKPALMQVQVWPAPRECHAEAG